MFVSSQAYEAARSERHRCRRGSAVVQLPTSSMQMDLHVTTEQPLGWELKFLLKSKKYFDL
jgi:hypothetical protein